MIASSKTGDTMDDYFNIRLADDDIRAISSIGLAHLGDAVYELLVRAYQLGLPLLGNANDE